MGATKWWGGGVTPVFPLQKGEGAADKVLAMQKGGGGPQQLDLTQELEVLAILKGGTKV